MDEATYNAIDALRHSHARDFAERGAGYFHAVRQGLIVRKETAALRVGTALHMAVLEPERFGAEYAVRPAFDRRTRAGKQGAAALAVAEWLAPASKAWVTADELEQLQHMRDAVRGSPLACRLLEACERVERAHVWTDQVFGSGLRLKARTDLASDRAPLVIDLKSTEDPSPDGFAKSVVRYGYDSQAVWYLAGEADRRGVPMDELVYVLIAVEKAPPWRVGIYELSAERRWITGAYEWCRRVLGEIADRTARNDWRDPWDGMRAELTPPRWYEESRGLR